MEEAAADGAAAGAGDRAEALGALGLKLVPRAGGLSGWESQDRYSLSYEDSDFPEKPVNVSRNCSILQHLQTRIHFANIETLTK